MPERRQQPDFDAKFDRIAAQFDRPESDTERPSLNPLDAATIKLRAALRSSQQWGDPIAIEERMLQKQHNPGYFTDTRLDMSQRLTLAQALGFIAKYEDANHADSADRGTDPYPTEIDRLNQVMAYDELLREMYEDRYAAFRSRNPDLDLAARLGMGTEHHA